MGLINTLDQPSEFDAAAKLRDGEPYFLLIGRDRLAPPRVLDWARDNRKRALDEFDRQLVTPEERDAELRKSTDAEQIAWAMQEYKNRWVAEQVEEAAPRPTYSGHEPSEETKRRDAIQAARTRAASALNNAVAELTDLAALLVVPLPDHVPRSLLGLVEHTIATCDAASDGVRPPRAVIDRSRDMDHAKQED